MHPSVRPCVWDLQAMGFILRLKLATKQHFTTTSYQVLPAGVAALRRSMAARDKVVVDRFLSHGVTLVSSPPGPAPAPTPSRPGPRAPPALHIPSHTSFVMHHVMVFIWCAESPHTGTASFLTTVNVSMYHRAMSMAPI